MTSETDTRPWRKRRPILSRVVLFGIGGALAVVMLVLWNTRKDEDRFVALRGELLSLDIVIGTPGGGDAVLEILERKFSDPDLPLDIRVGAIRWRAMALRHKALDGDEDAAAQVEPTYERALALTDDPDTRFGLSLERVEGLLEADEPLRALDVLHAAGLPTDGTWALLAEHFQGIGEALALGPELAADRMGAALAAFTPPLPLEPSVTAGGRTWNLPEIATVSTERLTKLYAELERDPKPLWIRLSELVANHTPSQIICVKELARMGDGRAADRAWIRARRADSRDAHLWADNDPAVGEVRARADG